MPIDKFIETDIFKNASKIFISINGGDVVPYRKKLFIKLKDNTKYDIIVIGTGFSDDIIEIDLMMYEREVII